MELLGSSEDKGPCVQGGSGAPLPAGDWGAVVGVPDKLVDGAAVAAPQGAVERRVRRGRPRHAPVLAERLEVPGDLRDEVGESGVGGVGVSQELCQVVQVADDAPVRRVKRPQTRPVDPVKPRVRSGLFDVSDALFGHGEQPAHEVEAGAAHALSQALRHRHRVGEVQNPAARVARLLGVKGRVPERSKGRARSRPRAGKVSSFFAYLVRVAPLCARLYIVSVL
mmetsp:Transcript_12423/g.29228  ORF Transcript_12423/g.29228 Transcript_12423/m.29228 type:complete len:224 (+) Transcript_12423:250-921(+)|eukprot:CAMPEP_0172586162 /NCGR_PEP_ID=MMETSP1068-20121228/5540_1 /TAXON_ID=35684 /ORGANISM="Pseudopedinella elastica, Strain CCMP716" /LENGTH=223 /DNA_ID=CAMNT_0013380865 /DNA_START=239 /DNA_END=910 /DNA_ORIENTATION=+